MLQALKGQLIASVQALPDEPLHGSETMVKMAGAVLDGAVQRHSVSNQLMISVQ